MNNKSLSLSNSVRLSESDSHIFLQLIMSEKMNDKITPVENLSESGPLDEIPALIQIVKKRVEVFSLPIKFTKEAIVSILIFADRPGAAVVWLIDLLELFEGKTVTLEMITEKYPFGFYCEKALEERIDFLKEDKLKEVDARECKFSYLY